jgi:hypothetical protein
LLDFHCFHGMAPPMTTRKSKIARLPFNIRELLNHQIMDNVPTKDILSWLNSDPMVRHYMERLFQNRFITEQNLSEWRQGAYQEWLDYRSCVEDVRDLSEQAARAALTDISGEHLLVALTAMFARMIKNMEKTPEIPFNRKVLVVQNLIKMALSLRRSEQRDEALRLKREQLEILREKKGHTSPSTRRSPNGPRASAFSNNLRAIPAHPLHPKAPEIRRPPAPLDPNIYPGHPDWPPQPPASYEPRPDPNDSPEPDAGPDGPYAPVPASGVSAPESHEMNQE